MGISISSITNFIEKTAPLAIAESYDNTGLILDSGKKIIEKIYICLDITDDTVEEAIIENADIIISHHPILFNSIQKIDAGIKSDMNLIKLIKNGISLYSAHTNFDSAEEGMNFHLAKLLGLEIMKDKTYNKPVLNESTDIKSCMGIIGKTERKIGKSYIEFVLSKLGGAGGRIIGDPEKSVENILVFSGSYKPDYEVLKNNEIDLIITGEVNYHDALEIRSLDITVLETGHFISEIIFRDIMRKLLENSFNDIDIITSKEKDIYKYI